MSKYVPVVGIYEVVVEGISAAETWCHEDSMVKVNIDVVVSAKPN